MPAIAHDAWNEDLLQQVLEGSRMLRVGDREYRFQYIPIPEATDVHQKHVREAPPCQVELFDPELIYLAGMTG
jgi:hypothetical protein